MARRTRRTKAARRRETVLRVLVVCALLVLIWGWIAIKTGGFQGDWTTGLFLLGIMVVSGGLAALVPPRYLTPWRR